MVGVISGAAPDDFIIAIQALMDFRYLAQAQVIKSNLLKKISGALQSFHEHKSSILDAGVQVGGKNNPINHFQILKLELMQGVVLSIEWAGAAAQ